MPSVLLKTIEIANGETIGYREREGGEEVIVLVHGNMTSSKHWDLLLEVLDEKYKLFAIDMRGFGLSSYNQPINSIQDFSEDLKLFVDALNLDSFTLIGWSTGGAVSMQFAIDYSDYVNKLILLASASTRGYPFMQMTGSGQAIRLKTKEEISQDPIKTIPILRAYETGETSILKQIWNALIYTANQPPADLYDEYVKDMTTQRNLVDVYHALNTFNISPVSNGLADGTNKASELKLPVLVLAGENDAVVTKPMTEELIKDIGSESLEFVSLKGCGHSPLVDDLEQLKKEIEKFLL